MNRAMTGMASGLLTISTFLGALAAQEPKPAQPPPGAVQAKAGETKPKDQEKKEAAAKAKAATEEEPIVSHHQMPFGGAELKYTATAGLMPIKDAKGEIEARIFFMAYTRDDAGPADSRPLLFSFNGGPGSASVWLHLGALGPRRVAVPDEPVIPAPPFALVDNDATWLDRADLVFIDPVGTGYSRAAKPELNAKFHSLSGDIDSRRRVHPDVPDAVQPMVLAPVPDRRELRHDPRRRAGRAPGRQRDRLQRRDPGLLRIGLPGVRLQPG